MTFTEAEIKEKLGKKFPKTEKIYEIIPVVIATPKVEFLEEEDRMQISLAASVEIPFSKKYDVSVIFVSGVRYEPKDKTLRLSKLEVKEIKATDLPENYAKPMATLASALSKKYLKDQKVYELKPKDFKNKAARMLIKKVEVKEKQLQVTFGL